MKRFCDTAGSGKRHPPGTHLQSPSQRWDEGLWRRDKTGCPHEILRNAADSLSLPLCPGGVRIPVSTTFFREFAGQDSRLGRPPRPSQPGSLQGSPQKGVFLAAETRNVQASPPAVKSKFLLVKIREHSIQRIPYLLVVGDKELETAGSSPQICRHFDFQQDRQGLKHC